jgi:hypothetical protein
MNLKTELSDLASALHWQHQHCSKSVVEHIVNETAMLLLHKMKVRMRLERKGMRADRQDFTEFDSDET